MDKFHFDIVVLLCAFHINKGRIEYFHFFIHVNDMITSLCHIFESYRELVSLCFFFIVFSLFVFSTRVLENIQDKNKVRFFPK